MQGRPGQTTFSSPSTGPRCSRSTSVPHSTGMEDGEARLSHFFLDEEQLLRDSLKFLVPFMIFTNCQEDARGGILLP